MPSNSSSILAADKPTQIKWDELGKIAPVMSDSAPVAAQRLVSPDSTEQCSKILAWANQCGAVVSVRGGATKRSWGNAGTNPDLVLSTEKMSRLVEHAWQDLTFTVQAGMKFSELQSQLAKHGQQLALDPLWADGCTVGGVVATNDSGTLRLRYGSVRDLILGATVVLASGTIARSGGKVVKNVAGYDLPKLLTGSMGTLAVITEATFRAHPLRRASQSLFFPFTDVTKANQFVLAVADSTLVPTAMQLRASSVGETGVDVRFDGVQAGINAQTASAISISGTPKYEEISPDVWRIRESLFDSDVDHVVVKISVLSTRIAEACNAAAQTFDSWKAVIQATGLGFARLQSASMETLGAKLLAFCEAVRNMDGTVVILDAPEPIRLATDVYGNANNSHTLMVRVKQQFDPNGILNRGRFIGGI